MDRERWRLSEPCDPTGTKGRNHDPKPRDCSGVRIEVNTCYVTEHPLRQHGRIGSRLSLCPQREQPLECPDQEVSRATSGINQSNLVEAEFVNCRTQRLVQDEPLDEFGRLQERETLLGSFGEVLVKVAEKASVEVWIGEVVHNEAGGRIDGCECGAQYFGTVCGRA